MNLVEYSLLALGSLFVVLDPVGGAPVFLAMTPNRSADSRLRTAHLACWVAAGVLLLFASTGRMLFKLFGITMPALELAGSILLLRIALDMLYARRSRAQDTNEEVEAAAAAEDVAIAPLAVPMLAGPGAISTVLILFNQATGVPEMIALFASIILTCTVTYWIFWLAVRGICYLKPLALKLATRLLGLLLAAVAVQSILNAVSQLPFLLK